MESKSDIKKRVDQEKRETTRIAIFFSVFKSSTYDLLFLPLVNGKKQVFNIEQMGFFI